MIKTYKANPEKETQDEGIASVISDMKAGDKLMLFPGMYLISNPKIFRDDIEISSIDLEKRAIIIIMSENPTPVVEDWESGKELKKNKEVDIISGRRMKKIW
jgi:hypothetical protein